MKNQVRDRVSADINSRQSELQYLLQQKESREIDRETETQRLRDSASQVASYLQEIESLI